MTKKQPYQNRIVGSGEANPADLIPNPQNWRRHPTQQQKAMAQALESVGWVQDVIVNKTTGRLIDGHLRVETALKNKEKTIPVKYVELSEDEERVALATFDPIGALAETDAAVLDALQKSVEMDFDFDAFNIGIDAEPKKKHTEEELEAVPEVPKTPKTKRGDIYRLGDHVLMCGDSTNEDDIKQLLSIGGGLHVDISFTSPPYNAGHMDVEGDKTTQKKYLHNDDYLSSSDYSVFLQKNLDLLITYSDEVFYNITLLSGNKPSIAMLFSNYNDKLKDLMFWVKTNATPVIVDGAMNTNVELIICYGKNNKKRFKNAQFKRGGCKSYVEGATASSTNKYANIHKATFPSYLPIHIIENFTAEGQIVFDCFGGTGTTLIACEETGRKCRMMELEPIYCDVIVERWEQFTGRKAELIS